MPRAGPSAARDRAGPSRPCSTTATRAGGRRLRSIRCRRDAVALVDDHRARGMRLVAPARCFRRAGPTTWRIDVDDAGTIVGRRRRRCRADGAERAAGRSCRAMPNLHSHAFQRALAGRTGQRQRGRRQLLDVAAGDVRVARPHRRRRVRGDRRAGLRRDAEGRLHGASPSSITCITTRRASLTPIRRSSRGASSPPRRTRASRSRCCRCSTRMRGFGGAPPTAGQRRFVHTVDTFARLVDSLARRRGRAAYVLGVAPHSLRAVTPDELAAVVALAPAGARSTSTRRSRRGRSPIASRGAARGRSSGCSTHAARRRALVHRPRDAHDRATRRGGWPRAARSPDSRRPPKPISATARFPRARISTRAARFGVGSDSNTIIDPFAELRQLEWSQRLARAVAQRARRSRGTGRAVALCARGRGGGAQALAQPVGAIAAGCRADLVVLDADDPALAGRGRRTRARRRDLRPVPATRCAT